MLASFGERCRDASSRTVRGGNCLAMAFGAGWVTKTRLHSPANERRPARYFRSLPYRVSEKSFRPSETPYCTTPSIAQVLMEGGQKGHVREGPKPSFVKCNGYLSGVEGVVAVVHLQLAPPPSHERRPTRYFRREAAKGFAKKHWDRGLAAACPPLAPARARRPQLRV